MPLPNKTVDNLKLIVKSLPNKSQELMTSIFSQDALDAIKANKMAEVPTNKNFKEIFFNFFGMSKNWKLRRNLIGGIMVHSPEYPTYFIPAFTQSQATGDATDLKKGEGPRGLITGGLEGLAVGALVSGEFLKPREMVPYIILGAALQMFSCTVFPWLGEKVGSQVYNKRMKKNSQYLSRNPEDDKTDVFKNFSGEKTTLIKPIGQNTYRLYNTPSSGNMRI